METTVNLQLALFFQDGIYRPDKIGGKINSSMNDLFDAMAVQLPVPHDAPADIPRIQMSSNDGRYKCNLSLSRVDLIIEENCDDKIIWDQLVRDFLEKVASFAESIFDQNLDIIRFGLIGRFFIPNDSASAVITEKFFKKGFESEEEMGVRFNKRSSSSEFILNNITSINTAKIKKNGVSQTCIFVELDINNVVTSPPNKIINLR